MTIRAPLFQVGVFNDQAFSGNQPRVCLLAGPADPVRDGGGGSRGGPSRSHPQTPGPRWEDRVGSTFVARQVPARGRTLHVGVDDDQARLVGAAAVTAFAGSILVA